MELLESVVGDAFQSKLAPVIHHQAGVKRELDMEEVEKMDFPCMGRSSAVMEDIGGGDVLHAGRSRADVVLEDKSAVVEVEDEYPVSQRRPVVTFSHWTK
jgi:hypothetical protein